MPDQTPRRCGMNYSEATLYQLETKLAVARRTKREVEDEITKLEEMIAAIKLQPLTERRTVEIANTQALV